MAKRQNRVRKKLKNLPGASGIPIKMYFSLALGMLSFFIGGYFFLVGQVFLFKKPSHVLEGALFSAVSVLIIGVRLAGWTSGSNLYNFLFKRRLAGRLLRAPLFQWVEPIEQPRLKKENLLVFLAYAAFTTAILWFPLTHLDHVLGTNDIVYFFPYKHMWIESLKAGDPAFWNPYSNLGAPFLAMSHVGAYAPFDFLFFITPLSIPIVMCYFIHFMISTMGTYFFARGLGCTWLGAFLTGLTFSFCSYFMIHLWCGHPDMVWAAAWIPWVLFFLNRFIKTQKWTPLFAATATMSLCILEGVPQISMYGFLISGFYLTWAWLGGRFSWKRLVLSVVLLFGFSMVLSACQVIPSYEFAKLCQRWYWSYNYIMCDYYYPSYLAFFFDPLIFGSPFKNNYTARWGYQEVCTYMGIIPFLLGVAGIFSLRKKPIAWLFGFSALLFTLLAMADSTVLTHYVYLFFFKFVPGFGRNRSVGRIMCLTMLALACLAGLLITEWSRYWAKKRNTEPWLKKAMGFWIPAVLLLATVVDLYQFDRSHMQCYQLGQFFDETMMFSPRVCKIIREDTSYPRVTPSSHNDYGIMQKFAQVESMYPMVIAEVQQYIVAEKDNRESPLPDLINLKYMTNPDLFKKPTERWKPLADDVVFNAKALPRVFVVGNYEKVADTTAAIDMIQSNKFNPREEVLLEQEPVEKLDGPKGWISDGRITRYDNNRVELECQNDRPGILFFSDPYYPGWKAWVDGEEKPILRADGAFRALVLSKPGFHRIQMDYHPPIIYISFLISLTAWFFWGVGLIFREPLGRWSSKALRGVPGFS